MKTPFVFLICVAALCPVFNSCQQEKPKETAVLLKPESTVNYRAISGKDTAWLAVDTSAKVVNGLLSFNYPEKKERFEGKFKGEMYGDTLKGHWDFKINKSEKWNRNPVAFLKRDTTLTMGVGQFMLIMGSAHFDDHVPIDYDRGRFVFHKR